MGVLQIVIFNEILSAMGMDGNKDAIFPLQNPKGLYGDAIEAFNHEVDKLAQSEARDGGGGGSAARNVLMQRIVTPDDSLPDSGSHCLRFTDFAFNLTVDAWSTHYKDFLSVEWNRQGGSAGDQRLQRLAEIILDSFSGMPNRNYGSKTNVDEKGNKHRIMLRNPSRRQMEQVITDMLKITLVDTHDLAVVRDAKAVAFMKIQNLLNKINRFDSTDVATITKH